MFGGIFSRSWNITKLTFNVIKKDKELLLFPLLGSIFSILFLIAMIVPTMLPSIMSGESPESYGTFNYVILFALYLGLSFIATFFNVCVVYTTKKRFEGGNATFGESINFASSKIQLIFLWSVLAATVGVILRIINNMARKSKGVGGIALAITTSLVGMAWSIGTIFVVPGMVYYGLGPIDAIKKSIETLKKTWGESLVRYLGMGFIQFVFAIIGIIAAIVLIIVSVSLGPSGIFLAIVVVLLAIIYFVILSLAFGVANAVFNTALFVYADTGKVPEGYTQEILSNAFKGKKTGGAESPGSSGVSPEEPAPETSVTEPPSSSSISSEEPDHGMSDSESSSSSGISPEEPILPSQDRA